MNCGPRGKCKKAYRKPGRDTVHCVIQTQKGGKWDFCAHQYFCQRTQKYELSREANECPMPVKEAEEAAEEAKEAIAEAEAVFAEEIIENQKPKKSTAKKPKKEG